MGANYWGIVNFGNIFLPYFKKKAKGYFIAVSSLADTRGFEGSGIYCSSKAAATRYLEAARAEMKHYGVKVMTIKPGFVDTNMTKKNKHKMPFLMSAERAAKKMQKAIYAEKLHYSFPWQTQLSAYVLEIIPDRLYDFLANMRGKLGQ
jgi:short-subunit dehydrogenase